MRAGIAALLLATACAEDPPVLPGTLPPPCRELVQRTFRMVELTPPAASDSGRIAFNLDEDPTGRPDASLVTAHSNLNIDSLLDLGMRELLDTGVLRWEFQVETCGEDPATWARVASYGVPAVGLRNGAEHYFVTQGTGYVPITAFFMLEPPPSPLNWFAASAIALEFDLEGDQAYGRLGFGVDARDGKLAPAYEDLAEAANDLIALDTGCPEGCNYSFARYLVEKGYLDGDGRITVEEVTSDTWFKSFTGADLDLYDGDDYRPRHDGIDDHLSFATAFRAVEL